MVEREGREGKHTFNVFSLKLSKMKHRYISNPKQVTKKFTKNEIGITLILFSSINIVIKLSIYSSQVGIETKYPCK